MSNLVVSLVLVVLAAPAWAAQSACPLPEHGTVSVDPGAAWSVGCGRSTTNPSSTNLQLTRKSGAQLKLMITVAWLDPDKRANVAGDKLKAAALASGERMLAQAVEKTLTLVPLTTPAVRGFMYTLTDKAPRPGEFKYMTQGTLVVGETLAMITYFFNDDPGANQAALLTLLAHLRHTP